MVRVLQVIVELDLKSVRPLKLFRPNTPFCSLFFENPFSETNEEDEKVFNERKLFVDKLIEAAPEKGRAWALDLNWQVPSCYLD
jgi:hypothetical protein